MPERLITLQYILQTEHTTLHTISNNALHTKCAATYIDSGSVHNCILKYLSHYLVCIHMHVQYVDILHGLLMTDYDAVYTTEHTVLVFYPSLHYICNVLLPT